MLLHQMTLRDRYELGYKELKPNLTEDHTKHIHNIVIMVFSSKELFWTRESTFN